MVYIRQVNLVALLLLLLPVVGSLTAEEKARFDVVATGGDGVTFTESGDNYVITSDGIPRHATGDFPNADNPNSLDAQSHSFTIKKTPTAASEERCLPMGTVGVALNGVPFFNPYTREGNDAVTGEYAEVFDDCDGHPAERGVYHYHKIPSCLEIDASGTALGDVSTATLVGVALDGYPIYGPIFPDGSTVTSDQLDRCHGREEADGSYRYYLSADFPYVIGCYHGEVVDDSILNSRSRDCSFATAEDYLGSGSVTRHSSLLSAVHCAVLVMKHVWCQVL